MSIVPSASEYQKTAILNNGLDNFYVRTTHASGPYSVTALDTIIAITGTSGAVITLQSVGTHIKLHKKLLVINDEGGNAGSSAITITPAAGEEIDGVTGNYTLDWDRAGVMLYAEPEGPGWQIMGKQDVSGGGESYTPGDTNDWAGGDPSTFTAALDRLAAAYTSAHGAVP